MVKQVVNVGAAADDGTGDAVRTAFGKVNANFDELYDGTNISSVTAGDLLYGTGPGQLSRLAHPGVAGRQMITTPSGYSFALPGANLVKTWDDYGAVGDAEYCWASTTAGSNVATIYVRSVTAADIGRRIAISGAAGSGNGFFATISAVNTALNQVTMVKISNGTAENAAATLSSSDCIIGTDDTAAQDAAVTDVSSQGGGTIRGLPGRIYLRNRELWLQDGVTIRESWLAARWTGTSGVHPIHKTCVVPGFVHGAALNLTTPSTSYTHYTINAVGRGDNTVTGTTAGQITGSPIVVGMVIGIRSLAAVGSGTAGAVEVPHRLFYSKVIAKSGDVLTLQDAAPWDIATARIFYVDPGNTAVTNGPLAAPTAIVSDCAVIDCTLDASHPFWGGAAYNFVATNIRPAPGRDWSEIITLNSITHGVVGNFVNSNWTYTAVEWKLGCGDVDCFNIVGRYRPGGSVYTPITVGESSWSIDIHDCVLQVPSTFNDTSYVFVDLRNCSEVSVSYNTLICEAAGMDAIVAIAPTQTDTYACRGIELHKNTIVTTTGTKRVFKLGYPLTSGQESLYIPIQGLKVTDNELHGPLNPTVNEWAALAGADGLNVRGNVVDGYVAGSVGPSQANLGARLLGYYEGALHRNAQVYSTGLVGPEMATTGWIDIAGGTGTTPSFGMPLPNRAIITRVLIEVQTAFDGTSANTIHIGHGATNNAFVASAPAGTAQVLQYIGGAATPAAGGTNGTGLGKRIGGYSATSTRQPKITYNGTSPTVGKALVTLFYVTGAADK